MINNQPKILIIAAEGFEESELVVPFDLWTRFGYKCQIVSLCGTERIKSKDGISIVPDILWNDFLAKYQDLKSVPNDFGAIFLPGGPGYLEYLKSNQLKNLVKIFKNSPKFLTAICAAPMVLDNWKIIENYKISVFPGFKDQIKNNEVIDQKSTIDRNVITGQNPAAVFAFSLNVIKAISGQEKSDSFKKMMRL
ncbi:DJ-1/PfpI family protein [Mycoplasma sp. SG1]|uniref:DJ-1/PfpI family protein n=1 Tax=Mycoplasma sp. SG1 TaxID=2810348 RepID=UPI002023CF66|nr:DJ-1/PfpI family protein [Mycoplasma sp. SG1]URM53127.1 DJ-1/PfpI family protein [Mycoplasma sp. SG1]